MIRVYGWYHLLTKNRKDMEPQFIKRWKGYYYQTENGNKEQEKSFWVMVFQRKSILNHGRKNQSQYLETVKVENVYNRMYV